MPTKNILLAAATVVALAGCGKKAENQAAEGPSCAAAIAKAVNAMPAGPGGAEVQKKLETVMVTRCTEDKWPAEAIDCYATRANDMASMRTCRELLPGDQQQKLMADIRTVMMAAASAGGGPMHGAPSAGSAADGSGSAAE